MDPSLSASGRDSCPQNKEEPIDPDAVLDDVLASHCASLYSAVEAALNTEAGLRFLKRITGELEDRQ